jgi:hypothetical protein
MPQNRMDGLQTLLRLRSPQNMTGSTSQTRDIATGEDWMEPSELEQIEGALSTNDAMMHRTGGAYGWSPSREQVRDAGMSNLRKTLNIGGIEHGRKMQTVTAPQQIAGEFGMKRQQLSNEGDLAVEKERRAGQQDYYKYLQDSGIDPTRVSRGGVSVSTGAGSQNQVDPPTGSQTTALSKARTAYQGGTMNSVRRMLGMQPSGRQDYEAALNDVLVRSGSLQGLQQALPELQQAQGATLEERILNAGYDATGLSPYEMEWLKLQLGE